MTRFPALMPIRDTIAIETAQRTEFRISAPQGHAASFNGFSPTRSAATCTPLLAQGIASRTHQMVAAWTWRGSEAGPPLQF